MSLWAHRSPRPERLVRALARRLAASWPADPLARVTVVVGSRGMERWLRAELATRHGSVAGVDFVFAGRAFAAATDALLASSAATPLPPVDDARWSGAALTLRVLRALRARLAEPAFARVRRSLDGPTGPTGPRELAFARAVASVVERLHYDRPRQALAWTQAPHDVDDGAAGHRWLALLLADLAAGQPLHTTPAGRLAALQALATTTTTTTTTTPSSTATTAGGGGHPPLFVFGLSSLRPGDKERLVALAPHLDLHLFALVPSPQWWSDIRANVDVRRALRRTTDAAERAGLLERLRRDNPLLVAHGAVSRDLQLWLEEVGYLSEEDEEDDDDGGDPGADDAPPRTRLGQLQRFVHSVAEAPAATTRWSDDGIVDAAALTGDVAREPAPHGPDDGADDGPDDGPDEAGHAGARDGAARPPGAGGAPASTTRALPSLSLHACHGALRQCEVLRDELLRRFAHDHTLEPRHVLVMTPDLATFAPLVAAVFGRADDDAPALPVHIADLGLRDTNPVAAALLDVLALVDERVSASRLLALLAHAPVRQRFALDDDDLAAIRELVAASGLRWAWDADDRARHDQPALDQNTVRFALERLALGLLMPDPGGVAVVPAAGGLGPALPVELPTREQAARFGALASLCRTLQQQLLVLRAPTSAAGWRDRLLGLVDALCAVPDERGWQRTQVTTLLAELLPDAPLPDAPSPDAPSPAAPSPDAGASPSSSPPSSSSSSSSSDVSLTAAAVASLLSGAFAVPRSGDRPTTGAVTLCSMEPMRSVPFRVIALLGMDDGAFPRVDRPPSWDPFAAPAPFEHDRRSLDRHLFLESILCARDALIVLGRGFEGSRGEGVPLSVVVEELAELLHGALPAAAAAAAAAGRPGDARRVLREHPLQPWSPRAYADPAGLPFGAAGVAAAQARHTPPRPAGIAATSSAAVWPAELAPPRTVTADALARALDHAAACLLGEALDLRRAWRPRDVEDREPLALDGLASWRLRDDLLDVAQAGAVALDVAAVLDRQRATGDLPLQAGGEAVLAAEVAAARDIAARAQQIGAPVATAALARCVVDAEDPIDVAATIPAVRVDAEGRRIHVWATAAKGPNEQQQLAAWLSLLVAVVEGDAVAEARFVGKEDVLTLRAPPADEARQHLVVAVGLWRRARRGPVLLLPAFSRALAAEADKDAGATAEAVVQACLKHWHDDDDDDAGGADDPAMALFGALSAEELLARADEVVALACAVWGPLLAAVVKRPRKKRSPDDADDDDAGAAGDAGDAAAGGEG